MTRRARPRLLNGGRVCAVRLRGRAEPQPAQNSEPWALKVLESKLCTQIFGFTYTRAHGPSLACSLSHDSAHPSGATAAAGALQSGGFLHVA